MRFRRTKDSNSKFRKIKILIRNMRKVNFFWESVMNMKNNEVMDIFK